MSRASGSGGSHVQPAVRRGDVDLDGRVGWDFGPDGRTAAFPSINAVRQRVIRVSSGERCEACGRMIDTMAGCACGPEV